jgi:predicted PurR-regulated permease PerM
MEPDSQASQNESLALFVAKAGLLLAMTGAAVSAWMLRDVLFILFGALVLAIGMSAMAKLLSSRIRIGYPAAISIVVIIWLALIGAIGWFFGATIGEQLDELVRKIPAGLKSLSDEIETRPYMHDLLPKLQTADLLGTTGRIANALATAIQSSVGIAGSLLAMAIIAIYLAAEPQRYRSGLLRLLPLSMHRRASELFDATAEILGRWLAGQLMVMATVGLLSGLGLWALGIKAAFVLGLVGGLMSFVPYVGAIITAVPATLFALTQGPYYALAVVAMYAVVHFIEGNFITPIIQSEVTSLPPVVSLLSVIACAILLGPSAVLLAAPLALFVVTVIEVLYIKPMDEGPTKSSLRYKIPSPVGDANKCSGID